MYGVWREHDTLWGAQRAEDRFAIRGTGCNGIDSKTACDGASGAECWWLEREQKCVSQGLLVEDKGNVYELDTGSSVTVLSPEHCRANNLQTVPSPIAEHYASTPNAEVFPTRMPHMMLGRLTHPTCSSEAMLGVPGAGLVGLRPARRDQTRPYSFMDSVPEGERKVAINKELGTVCIGGACLDSNYGGTPFIDVGPHPLVGFYRKGQALLLDTGSRETWKLSDGICILGNSDIKSLDIDYDNRLFWYEIDDTNIAAACGPDAPTFNWDA